MSEVFEHNPNDHEDPLAGPTWLVGLLGAVLLVVTVLGVIALYQNAQTAEDESKIVNSDVVEFETLLADQQRRLEIPHQVVYEEEIATAIPIEHAMELVVEEYGGR